MRFLARSTALLGAILIVAYGLFATDDHGDLGWFIILGVAFILLVVAIWPRLPAGTPRFERSLIRTAVFFFVAFALVTVQLVRIQIVDSDRILAREAETADGSVVVNPRHRILAAEVVRGRILASNGEPIADTVVDADGQWRRAYGDPVASYLAGYYSPLLYGSSNLEQSYDDYLTGQTGGNPVTEWLDGILHRTKRGYDLTLSIDLDLQRQADALLGDRQGAVVLMDAKTGAILAMVSKPHYDPSRLYTGFGPDSDAQIAEAKAYWEQLRQMGPDASPLVLRPVQSAYTPGSTFKIVTASAALETGIAKPDTVYRDEGALTVESRIIEEENRPDPNRIDYTLTEAFGYSLNVVFAQIGLQLGPDRLEQYATRFGFGQSIPFDLPVAESQVATDPAFLSNNAALADTAFGQGQLLATPLHMAMAASAVANGGEMMRPYLVDRVSRFDGETLHERAPEVWKRAISEETAAQMRDIMVKSVEQGYAQGAAIPGYVVGGKTGTAEVGERQPHAWFVGFAGKDEPQYAVAVVVEHGGEGSTVALPIARGVLQAALQRNAQ